MLDLAILGLLEERGELHGYEIRKQLREGLGLLANVSYGSLYPALARLEAGGAVEATEAAAPPAPPARSVPPTGSISGEWAVLRSRSRAGLRDRGRRSRKVYRITPHGRTVFGDLLAGPDAAEDPRAFGLRLAFARHLPAPARLALLERRRTQLLARLDEASSGDGRHLDRYARAVVEHLADALRDDIGWLDRLIEAERSATARAAAAVAGGDQDLPAAPGRPAVART